MMAGMGDEEIKQHEKLIQSTPVGIAAAEEAKKVKASAPSKGRSTGIKPKAAAARKPAVGAKSNVTTQPQPKAIPYTYATDKQRTDALLGAPDYSRSDPVLNYVIKNATRNERPK